jgi:hypothetical protein
MTKEKKIHKIKFVDRCKECGEIKLIGEKTGECLDCLDWKMDELRK